MPQTPNFNQIADDLLGAIGINELSPTQGIGTVRRAIIEQLRLTWNARGAADIATIEMTLSTAMGSSAAGPYVKNLDRDLRKLDR